MLVTTQQQKAFFDRTDDRSFPHLPEAPSYAEIRTALAENNRSCPLNEVVVSSANEGNMRTLRRFAFSAYRNYNHSCRGCNFGIYSPPGQGKTFVVKKFAETIGLPFVFVQSPSLENAYMLFEQIRDTLAKSDIPLVEQNHKDYDYYIPPCIVFFDEAHELKNSLMRGSLLNAMEPNDAMLIFKTPGAKGDIVRVDCWEVCWIAATTDRGDLFDAFDSRLSTAIEWHPAEGDELTNIVRSGLRQKVKGGELPFCPPDEICRLIGSYQKVPRLAIHGFGTKVVQHKMYMPSCSWEECCEVVAGDIGMNEYGFTKKQVAVLTALGQRPIAETRLADIAQCRLAQLKKYELPGLMQYTGGGPYVVSFSGKGMCITKAGLDKLDKMGIGHNGRKITADYFESKRQNRRACQNITPRHGKGRTAMSEEIKNVKTYDEGGKGKKLCSQCNKYVGAVTKICACGFDFKNQEKKVVIKEASEIKTYSEGGKGKKQCPECKKYVGAVTKLCVCGHAFQKEIKAKPPVTQRSEEKTDTKTEPRPSVSSRMLGCRYSITAPAGKCPHKLESTEPEAIDEWIDKVRSSFQKECKFLTAKGLIYFVRHFYEMFSPDYQKVKNYIEESLAHELAYGLG